MSGNSLTLNRVSTVCAQQSDATLGRGSIDGQDRQTHAARRSTSPQVLCSLPGFVDLCRLKADGVRFQPPPDPARAQKPTMLGQLLLWLARGIDDAENVQNDSRNDETDIAEAGEHHPQQAGRDAATAHLAQTWDKEAQQGGLRRGSRVPRLQLLWVARATGGDERCASRGRAGGGMPGDLSRDKLVDLTALYLQLTQSVVEVLVAVLALFGPDEDDLGADTAARGLRTGRCCFAGARRLAAQGRIGAALARGWRGC